MTRNDIVGEAERTGYTHVRTASGWVPLRDWTPYGRTFGHRTSFRIADGMIHEARHDELDGINCPPFAMGLWDLRTS